MVTLTAKCRDFVLFFYDKCWHCKIMPVFTGPVHLFRNVKIVFFHPKKYHLHVLNVPTCRYCLLENTKTEWKRVKVNLYHRVIIPFCNLSEEPTRILWCFFNVHYVHLFMWSTAYLKAISSTLLVSSKSPPSRSSVIINQKI